MDVIDELNRLDRLHNLIRVQSTGSMPELAEKLEVSERTAFRLIALLKDMGCPIYFNKYKNSYCYEYPILLTFLKVEEKSLNNEKKYKLDNEDFIKIIGGSTNIFFQTANFWQSEYLPLQCWKGNAENFQQMFK